MHLGLVYKVHPQSENKVKSKTPAGQLLFGLVGYTSSNNAGNPADRKLVIKHFFFIHGVIVFWCSKKQRTMSTFTTKAKYIVLGHAGRKNV